MRLGLGVETGAGMCYSYLKHKNGFNLVSLQKWKREKESVIESTGAGLSFLSLRAEMPTKEGITMVSHRQYENLSVFTPLLTSLR